jgi:hypothetical protein
MTEEKNKTQKGDNESVESAGLDTGSLPYREHLRGLERSLEEVRALRERSLALEGRALSLRGESAKLLDTDGKEAEESALAVGAPGGVKIR